MKKIRYNICILATVLVMTSCGDFLGKHPSDQTFVNNTDDLKELLLGEGYMSPSMGADIGEWIHLMDDDVVLKVSSATFRPENNDFFWWEPYVETQDVWTVLYKRINIMNAILDEIDRFQGEELYKRIKGEALFLRGAYYYFLVNIYAVPYRAEMADAEMGVPLKLVPEVEDRRYERASLAACYERIITDLTDAAVYMKGLQPENGNQYRAGEMAVHILLSRIYLYMGEWQKCVDESTMVIESGDYALLDFRSMLAGSDAVFRDSPETIFSSGKSHTWNSSFSEMSDPRYSYSDELWGMYGANDNRSVVFRRGTNPQYRPVKRSSQTGVGANSDFFMLRLPEAFLNRAEALAMLGNNDEGARNDINALRRMRIKDYTDETTLAGEGLVQLIRDERRREFCFEGQRWFDLRRYAVSSKYPMQKEIRHPYGLGTPLDTEIVLGTYDEDAAYYVLPIPENEIQMNGGMLKQNPQRVRKEPL